MDIVPSLIWLSSITGATLFVSGGRLWGKALAVREAIAPLIRADREGRGRAEEEAIAARRACEEAGRALAEERANVAALSAEIERREREIEHKEAENDALRRDLERLTGKAEEVENLRSRVDDLEAFVFAHQDPQSTPTPRVQHDVLNRARRQAAPRSGETKLETAIEDRLDELRLHERGCRTAVLSDMRGLLLASAGDTVHDDDLAAAASMTTATTERLRQLLPFGEPLEIRLTDVNRVVLTARWLHCDEGGLLLSTLGVSTAPADPRADAISASISNLVSSV